MMLSSTKLKMLFLTLLVTTLTSFSAVAQDREDNALSIRSTFLMHIFNYTLRLKENGQSPVSAFCFLEDSPYNYYTTVSQPELLSGANTPLRVDKVDSIEQAKRRQCRYLFIAKERESEALFEQLKLLNNSMVTIGETANFVNKGGVVGLVERAQKIKIVINRDGYKQAPVKFSARLLRYANFTG